MGRNLTRQRYHVRVSAPRRVSLATRLWGLREMTKANARRRAKRERFVDLSRSRSMTFIAMQGG